MLIFKIRYPLQKNVKYCNANEKFAKSASVGFALAFIQKYVNPSKNRSKKNSGFLSFLL